MSEIKRLGGCTNAVVVQLPERQNPGVVIQFDSISNLQALVQDAKGCMSCLDYEEAAGILDELDRLLAGYVGVFDGIPSNDL